ncbi:MAG: hypothetical protein RSE18_14645 [Acinetobacter sp.]
MEKDKHLGLHIDRELHYKLQYVSKYDGRSVSGEVLYLLRRYITDFENQHGEIALPVEEEK